MLIVLLTKHFLIIQVIIKLMLYGLQKVNESQRISEYEV